MKQTNPLSTPNMQPLHLQSVARSGRPRSPTPWRLVLGILLGLNGSLTPNLAFGGEPAPDPAPAADLATPEAGPPPAAKASVRLVSLQGTYQDHPDASGLNALDLLAADFAKPRSFPKLCRALAEMADDRQVNHVLFDLSSTSLRMNLAQLSELARHINHLHAAGKRTFAWLENAATVHYSIASACDTIIMSEVAWLDLPSLSLTTLHFREAMDLLGVEASVARTGNFKGAVEPFTRAEMSPELRAHYHDLLSSMNDALVHRIAVARNLPPEEIRRAQAARLFTAKAAQQAGLVDHLAPPGTARDLVAQLLARKISWIEPPRHQAKQLSFFELVGKLLGGETATKTTRPSLAVLHLQGQIIDGSKELPGLLVAGPLLQTIAKLEKNPEIRAVVVRINSPGGSASASETIRLALERLAEKKPVVISMGAMAASGGYWIACLGRPIYAEAETLTGSIGVFALKLSAAGLLHRIGLNIETVQLDPSANAMSVARPWAVAEQERIQAMIDDLYERFLELVASSRKLPRGDLADLAGGRVWSGTQAKALGLVDHLGGLDTAMNAVAQEAGLVGDYPVLHYPEAKSWLETLDLLGESSDEIQSLLTPTARTLLRQTGFDLATPLLLLRQNLSGQPNILWLLAPTEFVIR